MNIYRVLGTAIAESVGAVGSAVRHLDMASMSTSTSTSAPGLPPAAGWADQFSEASHDQRRSRRTVDALYRGATVRL